MKNLFLISLIVFLNSCTKEKKYQYQVDDVNLAQSKGEKNNQKSTTEFISIAYADLFNTPISQSRLVNLSIAYASFGDLKVIEDRIIRNFLNDTTAHIPSAVSENGDTTLFITRTYTKFFNREPNEYEKYYWLQLIRNDSSVTPLTVYYAMMTSDEYRYY